MFLSWVPIVGSAAGNALGGWLCDVAVAGPQAPHVPQAQLGQLGQQERRKQQQQSTSEACNRRSGGDNLNSWYEPVLAMSADVIGGESGLEMQIMQNMQSMSQQESTLDECSHVYDSPIPGADIHGTNLSPYSRNKSCTEATSTADTDSASASSTEDTTPAAACTPAVVSATAHTPYAAANRLLILSLGNFLAMPLVCAALVLGYPACFVVQIFSGLLAEGYMGQALAIIGDCVLLQMAPQLRIPATAVFLLLVSNIASCIQYLIPLFESQVGFDSPITVNFNAAPVWSGSSTGNDSVSSGSVQYFQHCLFSMYY